MTNYDDFKGDIKLDIRHSPETETSLHLYRVMAKAFKSIAERTTGSIKTYGMNPTEFAVLELLYHKGPQALQQIGSKVLLFSGNTTYVIDKLEQNGLLRREPCPTDRRVIHAALTDKGRETMEAIFPQHADLINDTLSGLSEEEKQQAIALLKKLGLEAENKLSAKDKRQATS